MSGKNDIRIDVVGDAGGFSSAAKAAEKELDGLKGASVETATGLRGTALAGELLTGALGGMASAATLAAGGLVAWVTAQLAATLAIKDTADEVGKMAQRMGESVESVSELRYAFGMAGADAGEMASLMKSLDNKAQDAARGVGSAARAFDAMKISVADGNGRLKDSRQLLEEVADKISGYRDSAAKAALVQDALGSGWVRLIPLLNGGAQGFRDAAAEAHQLGVVFDENLTKQAADLNDNLTRIKAAAEGAKIALGSDLMPTLVALTEEFVQGIKAAGGFWNALMMGATLNPFNSQLENIRAVRGDLAKMDADLKEYGYLDDKRYERKSAQLRYLQAMQGDQDKRGFAALSEGLPNLDVRPDAPLPAGKPAKTPRSGGGGGSKVSDYERLTQSLQERIAVQNLELASTERLTAGEREHAKWLADVETGRRKLTAAEFAAGEAQWQELLGLEKKNAAHQEYLAALKAQEAANQKASVAMLDKIALAEKETELYGLTAAQISVVEQARLADAIALAAERGATDAQLAVMREELRLRGLLSEALSKKEAKVYEVEDAKKAVEADGKELGEFAKQAAKNMQDAMADFFIDPTKKGMQSIAETFGQTVQKMIAQAAAAQLGKLLFGDMDRSGNLGGWVGKIFGGMGSAFGGGSAAAAGSAFSAADLAWLETPMSAALFHGGGLVGAVGTASRLVPAGAFAHAPRFHDGGFAGDEVPAILQKGERVLTKEQQRESGGVTVHQNITVGAGADKQMVKRAAASGARNVLAVAAGSQRYG